MESKEKSVVPIPNPKPRFCLIEREAPVYIPGESFAIGKPPYETEKEKKQYLRKKKELQRWEAKQTAIRLKKKKIRRMLIVPRSPFRCAFPLSPEQGKRMSFFLEWILHYFPRNSLLAVQHFHRIIAPPLPGVQKLFLYSKEDIQSIAKAFFTQLRCRWTFRMFLNRILSRKLKKINEVDPITLEPFQHPVNIVNLNHRTIYTFESKSLAKLWSTNLLQHDGLFTEPRWPINPYTNLPFNHLELYQGHQQIRKNGHTDWVLESFASCHYEMQNWRIKFGVSLRIQCIQNVFADKNSFDRSEMLLDFIEMQHQLHGRNFDPRFYTWMLNNPETVDFANLWSTECRKYYIEKYAITDRDDLDDLEVKTSIFCARLVDVPEVIQQMYKIFLESKRKTRNGSRLSITITFPNNPELNVNRVISSGASHVSTEGQ